MTNNLNLGIIAIFPLLLAQIAADTDIEKLLDKINRMKSVLFKTEGVFELPKSDDIEFEIKSLYLPPQLIYIDFKTTGGQTDFIVRNGDKALVWHPLEEIWIDPQLLGKGASGTRLQNPAYILKILEQNKENVIEKNETGTEIILRIDISSGSIKEFIMDIIETDEIIWDKTGTKLTITINKKSGNPVEVKCSSEFPLKEGTALLNFSTEFLYPDNLTELKFERIEGTRKKVITLDEAAKRELLIK